MNPREAITELEQTYDKNLTDFQVTRYTRFLGKFNMADIDKIVEKAIEDSRYLPRIGQLNDAAKDLLILQPVRRRREDPGCSICSGTGWEYVKAVRKQTGQEVDAVERCSCREPPPMPQLTGEVEDTPF